MFQTTEDILCSFVPVRLEEMDKVRLMDRIDTKYVLSVSRISDLLQLMLLNYRILEINDRRSSVYSTTYLDTPEYLFFNQHVTGRPYRNKIRFRKYDSTGISYLEIKHKTQKDRTIKWRIENKFNDDPGNKNARDFICSHVSADGQNLNKVLINNFKRITFTGIKSPERITIDMEMSFRNPEGMIKELPAIAIAELKSTGSPSKSVFSSIARKVHLYPTGFSKYCIGIALLSDLPHKNNLKPKFLLINHIENEYYRSVSD